ncbi:hypothetical protein CHUAL_012070 [Chamberlinius hualienensis]
MSLQFKWEDYLVLAIVLFSPIIIALAVSMRKKQTMTEYFLAGKSIPLPLLTLSYFSSFAAGGMTGMTIETYVFGVQMMTAIIACLPITSLLLYYLVVPLFYQMQQMSILKYLELRFGSLMGVLALGTLLLLMLAIGAVNVFVAAVAIQQVSAVSFWTAATIMMVTCILYSTLGGMRGIVVANAIQAIVLLISLILIMSIGLSAVGLTNFWNFNYLYQRFKLDFSFDPTIRHSVWSNVIGFSWLNICFVLTSQILLQHCMMTSKLEDARKLSLLGSAFTFIYQLIFMLLGLVIFAYYNGCNIIETGKVKSVNQVLVYFAMDLFQSYPTLPAIFFGGIVSATLSTTAALLNASSAILIDRFTRNRPNLSDGLTTLISKALVVLNGVLMFLGLILVTSFYNFQQAAATFAATVSGPIFCVIVIGMFCPQANNKLITISMALGMTFGLWVTIGTMIYPSNEILATFADCNTNATLIIDNDVVADTSLWWLELMFYPSKFSYSYICLEVSVITVFIFIAGSIFCGPSKGTSASDGFNLDHIPPCVKKFHLKMSLKMRKTLERKI